MKRKITLLVTVLAGVGMTSCSIPYLESESTGSKSYVCKNYSIDKDKSIKNIAKAYDGYKDYEGRKAMAVAMDKEGRYVIGYSYDCSSEESAKRIALSKCERLNANIEIKPNAKCQIYAVGNKIVSDLK